MPANAIAPGNKARPSCSRQVLRQECFCAPPGLWRVSAASVPDAVWPRDLEPGVAFVALELEGRMADPEALCEH
jgi:hypothetical protein